MSKLAELRTEAAEHQAHLIKLTEKNNREIDRSKWPKDDQDAYTNALDEFRKADAEFRRLEQFEKDFEEIQRGEDFYYGKRETTTQEHKEDELKAIARRDHLTALESIARRDMNTAYKVLAESKAEKFEVWEGTKRTAPKTIDKHALMSSIDSAGGFTAPAEFIAQLQKDIAATAMIPAKCRMYNTDRNMIQLPGLASHATLPKIYPSKFTGQWVNEEDRTVTAQSTQGGAGYFEFVTIPVGIYEPAQIPITESLLEDTAVDLSGELSSVLAENTGPDLENAILTGDGLLRKPRGILTDLAGVSGFFVLSGTSSVVDYAGLVALNAALAPQYHAGAVWVMNQNTMGTVQKLSVSAGHYLVQPFTEIPSMFGKPIVISNFMPDEGSSNYPVMLANFDGYALAQQRTFTVRFYDQTTPFMRLVCGRWRIGGGIRRKQWFRLLKSHNS